MARGKYRLDTPKGQVQFAHDQHGVKAARDKAKELNVGNKIERWLNEWAGKHLAAKASTSSGRRRVNATYWPERKGTITQRGDEVSEVQWDDGTKDFIPNEQLVETGRG